MPILEWDLIAVLCPGLSMNCLCAVEGRLSPDCKLIAFPPYHLHDRVTSSLQRTVLRYWDRVWSTSPRLHLVRRFDFWLFAAPGPARFWTSWPFQRRVQSYNPKHCPPPDQALIWSFRTENYISRTADLSLPYVMSPVRLYFSE